MGLPSPLATEAKSAPPAADSNQQPKQHQQQQRNNNNRSAPKPATPLVGSAKSPTNVNGYAAVLKKSQSNTEGKNNSNNNNKQQQNQGKRPPSQPNSATVRPAALKSPTPLSASTPKASVTSPLIPPSSPFKLAIQHDTDEHNQPVLSPMAATNDKSASAAPTNSSTSSLHSYAPHPITIRNYSHNSMASHYTNSSQLSINSASDIHLKLASITSQEVERILARFRHQYTITLVAGSELSSELRDILRVEGCAECLQTDDDLYSTIVAGREESKAANNDTDKGTAADSTDNKGTRRYVVLQCNLLRCYHLIHLQCLLTAHVQKASTSSPLSVVPTLDVFHCTNYMKIIPKDDTTTVASALALGRRSSVNGSKQCLLELAMAHHISNAQILHINLPTTIATYVDSLTGSDVLHVPLSGDSANTQLRVQTLSAQKSGDGDDSHIQLLSPRPANTTTPTFVHARGKIHFRCTDMTTGLISNHICNYDLSPYATSSSDKEISLLMILIDQQTRNILTLVVTKLATTANAASKQSAISFRLDSVKYEYAQQLGVFSHFVPPLHYDAHNAALFYHSLSSPVLSPSHGALPYNTNAHAATNLIQLGVPASAEFMMRQQSGASVDLNFQQYQHLLNPTSPNSVLKPVSSSGTISPRSALYAIQHRNSLSATQHNPYQQAQTQPQVIVGMPSPPPASFDTTQQRQESFPTWNTLQSVSGSPQPGGEQQQYIDAQGQGIHQRQQHSNSNLYSEPSQQHTRQHHNRQHEHGNQNNPALAALQHINPNNPNDPSLLHLTVEQLVGNVARIAKTHAGSRLLQSKLEARDATYFNICYNEIQYCLSELAIDHYGHFCLEKLLLMCNNEQIHTLLQSISTNLTPIACQKHGSFSIQTLIDCITPDNTASIVLLMDSIRYNILPLITHPAGHFVILKILQKFDITYTLPIDSCIVQSLYDIAIDHHGLRVLKMYLHSRQQYEIYDICSVSVQLTLNLVENSYGNYFIQSLLDVCPVDVRTAIKSQMLGRYVKLSQSKFSSNVVEKCLIQSHQQWRSIIIGELVAPNVVKNVITDRYSNYVCQTAVTVANEEQLNLISTAVNPHLASLRENVRKKWKTLLVQAKQQLSIRGVPAVSGIAATSTDAEPISPPPAADANYSQTMMQHPATSPTSYPNVTFQQSPTDQYSQQQMPNAPYYH